MIRPNRWKCSGLAPILLVVAAGVIPAPARADLLPDETVEAFMEAQGINVTTLGRLYGPDNLTVISFTSSIDEAGKTFSFSTVAGSTYLGQSLSLVGSGAFNLSSGMWEMVSAGTLGTESWTGAGSGEFVDPPAHIEFDPDWIFQPPKPRPLLDAEGGISYIDTKDGTNRTLSFGSYRLTVLGQTQAVVHVEDSHFRTGGPWTWRIPLIEIGSQQFRVSSLGDVEAGTFEASVTAVPEPPSSVALLGAGLVVLLCARRRPGVSAARE